MEFVYPLAFELDHSGNAPTYIYAQWATATAYALDAKVRYQVNGYWHDFRCLITHTSSSTITPADSVYWQDVGSASVSGGYTYSTNVRLSAAATWTYGANVTANSINFDPADKRDYLATTDITSNYLRPSESVRRPEADIAARWLCLGAANAFAPLDYYHNSHLSGVDSNGSQCNPTFTLVAPAGLGGYLDRVCLAGLKWVTSIAVEVWLDGTKTETKTQSQEPPTGIQSMPYRAATIKLTTIEAWRYTTIQFKITLTASSASIWPECAAIGIGQAVYLGETEWEVATRLLSYSRKERNSDYGTVQFVKRGSAKAVQAVGYLDPAVMPGDVVQHQLAFFDGQPLFFDFNNANSSYDRLRVFGFWTKAETLIKAASFESLLIDIEGLVEL